MTKRAILLDALASTVPDLTRLLRSLEPSSAEAAGDVLADLLRQEQRFQQTTGELAGLIAPTSMPADAAPASATEWLTRFADQRQQTLALLASLPARMWQKRVIDHNGRTLTLRYLTQELVAHDIEMTGHLAALRAALRGTPVTPAETNA